MAEKSWKNAEPQYRDWSGGLNGYPPDSRIKDNEYAHGSQDLRRDRGVLETREPWTYALNNPTGVGAPVNGLFSWGAQGDDLLSVYPQVYPNGLSAVHKVVTVHSNHLELTTRALAAAGLYLCDVDGEAEIGLPVNGIQYANEMIFSRHFLLDPINQGDKRNCAQAYITPEKAVQYRQNLQEAIISMLGTIVAVFNHRLYFANDQVGNNHIFCSGPGKTLPGTRWNSQLNLATGPFQHYSASCYEYIKEHDMFASGEGGQGGSWIEIPEQNGEITALLPLASYMLIFTRKAIWKVGLDNSVRLVSSTCGTVSQQTVSVTPWGIIFLGLDHKLYLFKGTGDPQSFGTQIQNYLDDAYVDIPLYLDRTKWQSYDDFLWSKTGSDINNLTYVNDVGLKLSHPNLTGWWQSAVWGMDDIIRILSVKPNYTFSDSGAFNDEQSLAFAYRFSSNLFGTAVFPPNWKYLGAAWKRKQVPDHGTEDYSSLDFYPRPEGFNPSYKPAGHETDISLGSNRNDHYSSVKVHFTRDDFLFDGPVLQSLIATVLRGDMSKILAAPNMHYSAGKLRLNLSYDSVNYSTPYCDTSLVFDGKGWDLHKGRDAGREEFWQGRRFWGGCNFSNPDRWLFYEIENLSPQPNTAPVINGIWWSKNFDFGAPDTYKHVPALYLRFQQKKTGQIRVHLRREWQGEVKTGRTQLINIDNTGRYLTIGISVSTTDKGDSTVHPVIPAVDVGEGVLFKVGIESVNGAEWRLDSIKPKVEFGKEIKTHGLIPPASGGDPF